MMLAWLMIAAAVALMWHCPLFKPWFGFRRPPGARGRWFT
jgi:hypothetical protein